MKVEEAIDRLTNIERSISICTEQKKRDFEAIAMAIAAMEKGSEYLERINHQMQYITKLETYIAKNIPEWVPIKDRLPEEGNMILLQYRPFDTTNVDILAITYRHDGRHWHNLKSDIFPIAWMELPSIYIAPRP